ncbi:hypothetical protein P9239_02385 [Caballeronia sp. LZ062]|uniref:hypothetical protein n=1 Tax=unclassified Caballeronia TaxID=2646786 RepID=UPI002862A8F2|nr:MULTISPECIES: hypothetical protein [unclassified Caballeronia]MDR5857657.1 hypothetical protein [Caballeronia sp. LZ050]MDR5869207.1 hypothetical protein [Caballeronia sp. LZ062]
MKLVDMFRRARRGVTPGHAGDAEPHHEDHSGAAQKQARKLWDTVGRMRHKNAKWH